MRLLGPWEVQVLPDLNPSVQICFVINVQGPLAAKAMGGRHETATKEAQTSRFAESHPLPPG